MVLGHLADVDIDRLCNWPMSILTDCAIGRQKIPKQRIQPRNAVVNLQRMELGFHKADFVSKTFRFL